MISAILDKESLTNIKRTSYDDCGGLLLESNGLSVFLDYEVVTKIISFQKESDTFVSQIQTEQMLSELKPLVECSTTVTVADRTFLLRCIKDYKDTVAATPIQKKNIKRLYEKYVGSESKNENDNIPF